MKTTEINLYSLNELNKEARERVIKRYKERIYEDDCLLMFFQEDCAERIKEKGFNNIELQYSLSCSQGDGFSFSGDLDIRYFLDNIYSKKITEWKKDVVLERIYKIFSTGNEGRYCYCSENDIDIEYNSYEEYKKIDELCEDIVYEVRNYYCEICEEMEKAGYDEIEYRTSEECVIEEIKNNDILFTENGNHYYLV